MPKKIWYSIFVQTPQMQTPEKIAEVQSPGLTNVLVTKLEEFYKPIAGKIITAEGKKDHV